MSSVSIRAALETALNAMSPSISTAFENVAFSPTAGTAYQRVNVLFGTPLNDEISRSYEERGFMQVTLCYPVNAGPGTAATRAELVRSSFYRGRTLTASGVTVLINLTPEILPAFVDGDRYCIPVRVPFKAPITV